MEIVPHSQRELVEYEGNLTSCHLIFSFKACFTKLLNDFFASIFRYRRYNRPRIFSSYVQRKSLNVWSVYFFFDTLPWQHLLKNNSGNSGGEGGGYFSGQKLEILRGGGAYVKFPPWWEYGYFLELHDTHNSY